MRRDIRLEAPQALRPHEEISGKRLGKVIDRIWRAQAWTRPICVETTSLCVMDGHHRRLAALHLGLTVVPVFAFDYDEVLLGGWSSAFDCDGPEIVERSLSGRLMPAKSTRHLFPPVETDPIPLADLVGPAPRALRARSPVAHSI